MSARRFTSVPANPLPGIPPAAWRRLVDALEVQPVASVSASGGLGAYDLRPRRLVELGYASGLRYCRTAAGRQVHACEFARPWTEARFLSDPVAQYAALSRSLSLYFGALMNGELRRPAGVSLSGALAILHVGGRGALDGWPKLFDGTRVRYEAARDIF